MFYAYFGLWLCTFGVLFTAHNTPHFPECYTVFKVRFVVVTFRPSGCSACVAPCLPGNAFRCAFNDTNYTHFRPNVNSFCEICSVNSMQTDYAKFAFYTVVYTMSSVWLVWRVNKNRSIPLPILNIGRTFFIPEGLHKIRNSFTRSKTFYFIDKLWYDEK